MNDGSPLRLGVLVTLATLSFAAVIGLIAVIDADDVVSAFGTGLGIAFVVFVAGGTIACGLACLARRKLELLALGSLAAAGIAVDLLALAVWLGIDNEAYGKITGVAFVWTLFTLLILGLTLAVGTPDVVARALYLGAVVAAVAAGLISTWLIATADTVFDDPQAILGDEGLLRALGAALVLLAALWFGALAASRPQRTA